MEIFGLIWSILTTNPIVLAVVTLVGGLIFGQIKGRKDGANKEKLKQAEDQNRALKKVNHDIDSAIAAGRAPSVPESTDPNNRDIRGVQKKTLR